LATKQKQVFHLWGIDGQLILGQDTCFETYDFWKDLRSALTPQKRQFLRRFLISFCGLTNQL
jgi:hypothetical protein